MIKFVNDQLEYLKDKNWLWPVEKDKPFIEYIKVIWNTGVDSVNDSPIEGPYIRVLGNIILHKNFQELEYENLGNDYHWMNVPWDQFYMSNEMAPVENFDIDLTDIGHVEEREE